MCSTEPTRRNAIRRGAMGAAGLLALHGCGQSLDSVQAVSASPMAGTSPPESSTAGTVPVPPEAGIAPDGTVEVMPGLRIHPRSGRGTDLPPKSVFEIETVRFLLVHHTASSNNYDDPRVVTQNTHVFHTSSAKNWGDVAYHFFVARDGSVWEGRAGFLDGPVVADATGGNQGWAQLGLPDRQSRRTRAHAGSPSVARTGSEVADVAVSARQRPGGHHRLRVARVRQIPAGTPVTTPITSGHRDATYTACPGDAAYNLSPVWRQQVAALPDPVFVQTGRYTPAERLGPIEP